MDTVVARLGVAVQTFCRTRLLQASARLDTPKPVCDIPVVLSSDTSAGAFTNGERVRITEGMVVLAGDDAELAFVLGHEFGHVLLGHAALRGRERRQLEEEADYIGLYLAAMAGYDPAKGAAFILKFAQARPDIDAASADYPSSTQRYAMLRAALTEISHPSDSETPISPRLQSNPGRSFGFAPQLPVPPPP